LVWPTRILLKKSRQAFQAMNRSTIEQKFRTKDSQLKTPDWI
jgi:hypothetical protein